MIKAVIFDMGGVYINPQETRTRKKVAKYMKISLKKLNDVTDEIEDPFVEGKITKQEYWKLICKELGKPYDNKAVKRWSHEYRPIVNKEVKKLVLKLLKKKYKVPAITDVDTDRKKGNIKNHIYKLFRPVILSCDVKIRKPKPGIYRLTLKRIKCKPHECVFIDDMPRNIRGCKKIGIHGILFKNAAQVKRELKKLGVEF